MRRITKIRRSMRAISPVISVLLMIAIAVAASLVAYAWVSGYIDFTTTKVGKQIQIQSVAPNAVYVQNIGDAPVTIAEVYVDGDLVIRGVDYTIDDDELGPSETASITFADDLPTPQAKIKVVTTDGISAEYIKTFSGATGGGGTPTQYSLNVVVVPTGSGSVDLNATGPYAPGTVVQLTAISGLGWSFSEWGGALSGSASQATVVMDGHKTVTATFTQDEFSIAVTIVPSDAAGSVDPDIPAPYNYGDVVTLMPTANLGYTFDHWSGDGVDDGDNRIVTVTGNMAVTATFTQNEYSVTFAMGTGGDSMTPAAGTYTYNYNDEVSISATAATNYVFNQWESTGAVAIDNPTSESTTATITGDGTVTATFSLTTQTIYPEGASVSIGSQYSGELSDMQSSDDVYYTVRSTTWGSNRRIEYYCEFDIGDIGISRSDVTRLDVTLEGHYSTSRTQTVSIWNSASGGNWEQMDLTSIGTSDQTITFSITSDFNNYIDSSGNILIRIRTNAGSSTFDHYNDLFAIAVTYTP